MKIKTEEELWEVLGTLDKFNAYIQKVINHTVEITSRKVLLAVPALVIHHIKNEHSYERIKENFFKKNPELIQYHDVLGETLNQIGAKHPEYTLEKIFDLAAIEAKKIIRKRLEAKHE